MRTGSEKCRGRDDCGEPDFATASRIREAASVVDSYRSSITVGHDTVERLRDAPRNASYVEGE